MRVEVEEEESRMGIRKDLPPPKPGFYLEEHLVPLLRKEPFYAGISRHVSKICTERVPFAAVRFNPDRLCFEMLYNNVNMSRLEPSEVRAIIKHEFHHIMFHHLQGRSGVGGIAEDSKVKNICMDLAINCDIDELPEWTLMPERGEFKNFPPNKSWYFYYSHFKNQPKEWQDEIKKKYDLGEYSIDVHLDEDGQFVDSNGNVIDPSIIDKIIARAAKEGIEAAERAKNPGNVPVSISKALGYLNRGTVDWRKVLEFAVRKSVVGERRRTMRRLHKKFPYVFPRVTRGRTASVAVAIDQSGSVSDNLLEEFFSVLARLSDLVEFTVVPFDTTVKEDKVFVWHKGEKLPVERVACGGTCFNAPTDWVNKRGEFDLLIIATDMGAGMPKRCNIPRVWVTDKESQSWGLSPERERVVVVS